MNERETFSFGRMRDLVPWITVATVVIVAIILLNLQGRVWWCSVGDWSPWSWRVMSAHNSQHVIDPYSFTHILHGILEFWLIGLIFSKLPLAWRFAIAILIESSWEVVENTSYVINRYREATISLNYFGDSIINSVADITFCAVGFIVAWTIRFWLSLALFVTTEIILLFTIRDSLIINLIMLIYPIDAIRAWQAG